MMAPHSEGREEDLPAPADTEPCRDRTAASQLKRPLRLKPRFVPRLWGGDALPSFHGLEEPEPAASGRTDTAASNTTPIGESWLLGDDNEVLGGPLAGRLIKDLAREFGAELLGTANTERYGDKLALLAKFLDARLDLSVQVHPDDDYALSKERETGHLGKAEAWYVLATESAAQAEEPAPAEPTAEPGAAVLWGFARDTSTAEVRAAIASGTLEGLLNRLPVAPGDVIVNPAGMVHAVGAGVMLFEIQQSSDLTYRLYDYDRRDAAGNQRELHIEKALDVAQLQRSDASDMAGRLEAPSGTAAPQPDVWRRLVALPEFVMDVAELGGVQESGELNDATSAASFELLVLTRGEATVTAAGDEPESSVAMRRGDAVLLPAALGAYSVVGRGELLRSAVVKRFRR